MSPAVNNSDRLTWPAPPGGALSGFRWPTARGAADGLRWRKPMATTEREALAADKRMIDRGGVIYYFELDDHQGLISPLIKIGYTGNLAARRRSLEKVWGKIILIASEPGGFALEQLRHWQFAACRTPAMRLHGGTEFFEQNQALCPSLDAHLCWLLDQLHGHPTKGGRPVLRGEVAA